DGRDGKGRILVDVVVAAHGIGGGLGTERFLAAFRRDHRVGGLSGRSELVGLYVEPIGESPGDIVNKTRKAHGAARHVKYGFGFRAAADHVHVDDGFDALRSEEHTSELQSLTNLVCRLLLEKKK